LFENQTKEEFPMAAKKDDSSPKTEQGRREFLRASSIIAGGVILSQTMSSAQGDQGTKKDNGTKGIPLTTKLPDFPLLTEAEIARLTPEAQELTKGDLISLSRASTNREELTEERLLSLTVRDLDSIEEAFADYGVDRFEAVQDDDNGIACCCTCTPCCSCCASSVVKPIRVL
jgi:hypothetical protein